LSQAGFCVVMCGTITGRFNIAWRKVRRGARAQSAAVAIALLLAGSDSAFSQTIRYEVEDLGDIVLGEDLWRYRFFLSGFNFAEDQGLSIFFDYQNFSDLTLPSQPGLDPLWNLLVVQPDPLLFDDGFLDALAEGDSPSTVAPFTVDVVWLGQLGSTPGDLDYYTYDENFAVLTSGTVSQVPEPGVVTWLGLGAMLWAWRRITQKR
jgi:hypothetical protein